MPPTTSLDPAALEAPVSVLQDSGSKVVLTISVPGLKKRQGFLHSIWHTFHKASNPFHLASNAKFGNYNLNSTSLNFTVDVFENKASAKKAPTEAQKQRYACQIGKFPSRINADSAQFELLEGASGDCYFVLTCVKTDNYTTNWKEFLSANGTLDSSKV